MKWLDPILAILPTLLTAVVGFVSAWVLFVLTERRKASQAQRELRRALVAELENVEVMLSTIVAKYARYCENDEQVVLVAAEIRWFLTIGRRRMVEAGVLSPSAVPDTEQTLAKLGDQDLVKLYSSIDETQGTRIIVPVVDSLLSGRTSGFSASQIQSLVSVRWHTLNRPGFAGGCFV